MLLEYYRAYVLAKLSSKADEMISDDLLAQFIHHINNCLNYVFSDEF